METDTTQRIECFGLAPALLGHPLADVLPKVTKLGHLLAGDVVGDGHARQLDDPAFDGVHQGEVAHGPGEQSPLGITGAAQEERRRREVYDAGDAELALYGFQAGYPKPRGLVVLLRFLLVVAAQIADILFSGLLAIAMVCLVVEYEDALHTHQVGHNPLEHLAFGFQGI
jgi:hypothetical protein